MTKPDSSKDTCKTQCGTLETAGLPILDGAISPVASTVERPGHTARQVSLVKMSTDSVHLYNMRIHQQLRAQSAKSSMSSFYSISRPWNHQASRSTTSLDSIARPTIRRHHRHMSSSGFASSSVPSTWGHVVKDGTSSVYSRGPSAEPGTPDSSIAQFLAYELQFDSPVKSYLQLIRPLSETPTHVEHGGATENNEEDRTLCVSDTSDADNSKELQVPSANPTQELIDDGLNEIIAAKELHSTANSPDSTEKHSPSNSLLSKKKSFQSFGRMSRFREDMTSTPLKLLSRKKQSVMRFLFPSQGKVKLQRPQSRSISTPILWSSTSLAKEACVYKIGIYDGPSDGHELLTVTRPAHSGPSRSMSVSFNVPDTEFQEATLQVPTSLAVPSNHVRRSSSLADYERGLSVAGDDRRRPSAVNVQMLRDVQQDDRRLSIFRPLSRASPLFGPDGNRPENSLMEKALQKHQQEKAAMFRSPRRPVTPEIQAPAPVFNTPFAGSAPGSLWRQPTHLAELDPLDPLEGPSSRRVQSMQHLTQPHTPLFIPRKIAQKPSTLSTPSAVSRGKKHDIPLASWSRYPSHTRKARCESATKADGVLVRDFGTVPDLPRFMMEDTGSSTSPRSNDAVKGKKKRTWMRSATMGSVWRYYQHMFTSTAAQGRRTSVTTGGKLEYPELEMLPPLAPAHVSSLEPPHEHFSGRFLEHVREESHELFHHHGHHHSDADDRARNTSEESLVGPMDDSDAVQSEVARVSSDVSVSPFALDGGNEERRRENAEDADGRASEEMQLARRWSRFYASCVQLPPATDSTANAEIDTPSFPAQESLAPIATLHAPRSPSRFSSAPSTLLDSNAKIRHFPSVTVVDDQKGHWRSISLLSINSGRTRKSTNDLLMMIREAEGRAKEGLLGMIDGLKEGERVVNAV